MRKIRLAMLRKFSGVFGMAGRKTFRQHLKILDCIRKILKNSEDNKTTMQTRFSLLTDNIYLIEKKL